MTQYSAVHRSRKPRVLDDDSERSKQDVEVVAYIVGRYCGLDTSESAFYLAAWASDDAELVRERLGRISSTAEEIVDTIGR